MVPFLLSFRTSSGNRTRGMTQGQRSRHPDYRIGYAFPKSNKHGYKNTHQIPPYPPSNVLGIKQMNKYYYWLIWHKWQRAQVIMNCLLCVIVFVYGQSETSIPDLTYGFTCWGSQRYFILNSVCVGKLVEWNPKWPQKLWV